MDKFKNENSVKLRSVAMYFNNSDVLYKMFEFPSRRMNSWVYDCDTLMTVYVFPESVGA